MGVDRIAMLKYGVDDIQLFFQGDVRFLNSLGRAVVGRQSSVISLPVPTYIEIYDEIGGA